MKGAPSPRVFQYLETAPICRRGLLREQIRVTACMIVAETKSIKMISWLHGRKGHFTYCCGLRHVCEGVRLVPEMKTGMSRNVAATMYKIRSS